jgi:hypothetical protein
MYLAALSLALRSSISSSLARVSTGLAPPKMEAFETLVGAGLSDLSSSLPLAWSGSASNGFDLGAKFSLGLSRGASPSETNQKCQL